MNSPRPLARREDTRPPADLMAPLTRIEDVLYVSDILAKSELVPYSLRGKPASIFHVIMTGQALGLHWIEATRVIYSPAQGQIGLRGQFLLSQLRKAGHTYSFKEGDDWVEFTLVRGDTNEKFTSKFTIDKAIRAGLAQRTDKGDIVARSRDGKPLPWMLYTDRLLRWRAVSDGTSIGAPEVSLGFEIEGDLPEPPQPEVELRPETPAPPGPETGQAAQGDSQAEQVQQLRDLDQQMRPEPVRETLAREAEEAEAVAEQQEQDFPLADMPTMVVDVPVDEPVDAKGKAATVVLGEWFTTLGYDPRQYPTQVKRAMSVFTRRNVNKAAELRTAEVMALTNELSAIWRNPAKSELAPVSRLADKVDAWAEAWREEDSGGFAAYEEALAR